MLSHHPSFIRECRKAPCWEAERLRHAQLHPIQLDIVIRPEIVSLCLLLLSIQQCQKLPCCHCGRLRSGRHTLAPALSGAALRLLAPSSSPWMALADARRLSLSFVNGPSNSFSIVRTNVSIRRFNLLACSTCSYGLRSSGERNARTLVVSATSKTSRNERGVPIECGISVLPTVPSQACASCRSAPECQNSSMRAKIHAKIWYKDIADLPGNDPLPH